MAGEVYIDLYFLVNAAMDLLCLLLVARLCHAPTSRWRLLLSAALGGGYACAALLFGIDGVPALLLDLLVALFLTLAAFARQDVTPRRLLFLSLALFFLSAVLSGLLTLLYRGLNRLELPMGELPGEGASVWIFALLGGLSGVFTIVGGRFLGYAGKHRELTLILDFGAGQGRLRALMDSGNLLVDPIGGRGVVVAERGKILPLLPPHLRTRLSSNDPADWLGEGDDGLRLIPIDTASGRTLLPALLPKLLLLDDGRERLPADYLVALSDLGRAARGFDALLPPG